MGKACASNLFLFLLPCAVHKVWRSMQCVGCNKYCAASLYKFLQFFADFYFVSLLNWDRNGPMQRETMSFFFWVTNTVIWQCDFVVFSGPTVRLSVRCCAAVDGRSSAYPARHSAEHGAGALHSVFPTQGSDGSRWAGRPRAGSRSHRYEVQNLRVCRQHSCIYQGPVDCTAQWLSYGGFNELRPLTFHEIQSPWSSWHQQKLYQ